MIDQRIMRTGRVRYERFRRLNPEIVGAYERPFVGASPLPETVA